MPEPVDTEMERDIRAHNLTQETLINQRAVRGDLFATKSEQLLSWCRQRKVFSKADVIAYGLRSYYLRADRSIRDFVRQGIMRRLNDREKEQRALTGKMAWYEMMR